MELHSKYVRNIIKLLNDMADPETSAKTYLQDYHKRLNIYTAGIDGRRAIIEYLKPKKVISNFRIILISS